MVYTLSNNNLQKGKELGWGKKKKDTRHFILDIFKFKLTSKYCQVLLLESKWKHIIIMELKINCFLLPPQIKH